MSLTPPLEPLDQAKMLKALTQARTMATQPPQRTTSTSTTIVNPTPTAIQEIYKQPPPQYGTIDTKIALADNR
jgi:hypothetical protein